MTLSLKTASTILCLLGGLSGCSRNLIDEAEASDFTAVPTDVALSSLTPEEQARICGDLDTDLIVSVRGSVCEQVAAIHTHQAGGDAAACRATAADCNRRIDPQEAEYCAAQVAGWGACDATGRDLYACSQARKTLVEDLDFRCDALDAVTDEAIAAWEQRLQAADAPAECEPFTAACGAPPPLTDRFALPTAPPTRAWSRIVIELPEQAANQGLCAARVDCGPALVSVETRDVVEGDCPDGIDCILNTLLEPGCGTAEAPAYLPGRAGEPVSLRFDGDIDGCTLSVETFGGAVEGLEVRLCEGTHDECLPVAPGQPAEGGMAFELPAGAQYME